MHITKANSSRPWPSPSRRKRSKCDSQAPWVLQTAEKQTLPNRSRHTKASPLTRVPIWWPKMLLQHSRNTAQKQSWKQYRLCSDPWGRTWCCWNRSWRTPSDTPIAGPTCIWHCTLIDYAGTSWNVETSAWKLLSTPMTTSATLWSTREP